jgi:hypothetical protein
MYLLSRQKKSIAQIIQSLVRVSFFFQNNLFYRILWNKQAFYILEILILNKLASTCRYTIKVGTDIRVMRDP